MSSTTPRTSADENASRNFSPINVTESPLKILQGRNLTGTPRVIRDFVAHIYNILQKWNDYHILGAQTISRILDLKLSAICNGATEGALLYPEGLQQICDKLEQVCNALNDLVMNLKITSVQIKGFIQYEKLQNSSSTIMFYTWPIHKFDEMVGAVIESYTQELLVKKCVQENIGHCSTEETVILHAASWVHQPYITPDLDLLVESILQETGHRL